MTPQQYLANAGFTFVENEVQADNFALPYLQKINDRMSIREPLPTDFLRPWDAGIKVEPRVSLLHFSLHECDLCHDEIAYLHRFFAGKMLPGSFLPHKSPEHVAFFQVNYGTNATQLVADEMTPLLPEGGKTHLDLEDGLAERLGVVGAPGTWLLDEAGFVVGYRNGPMNFESPGFEALMGWLESRAKNSATSGVRRNLHEILIKSDGEMEAPRVKVLDGIFLHIFTVGIAAALCYACVRAIILRRRRSRKG